MRRIVGMVINTAAAVLALGGAALFCYLAFVVHPAMLGAAAATGFVGYRFAEEALAWKRSA